MSRKSRGIYLFFCIFLGILGVHRFYNGKWITGVLYLLTLGFLGLGVLIDLGFLILRYRENKYNSSKRNKILMKFLIILFALVLWISAGYYMVNNILNIPMVAEDYIEHVDAKLELEKKYTGYGDFEVNSIEYQIDEDLFGNYNIWFPTSLLESQEQYPLVVFANGTGVPFQKFSPIFEHLASWGFIVIGNDDDSSGNGLSSILSLNFALDLNSTKDSPLFDKIDTENIGISGHSQGGAGAINAVTKYPESQLFTSIYTASTPARPLIEELEVGEWDYQTQEIEIPYFMVAATGEFDADLIAPLSSLVENYGNLENDLPAILARRKNVDHGDTLTHADGYMTAWFLYTLMNDELASGVFVGEDAEIKLNIENWQDIRGQNLDEKVD